MTWNKTATVRVAREWQLTPLIDLNLGYVRLSFTTAGIPLFIAQIDPDSGDISDERRILATVRAQILEFPAPTPFTKRVLALRAPTITAPFDVTIEVSSLPISSGGSGSGGTIDLSPVLIGQTAILEQLQLIELDPQIAANIQSIVLSQTAQTTALNQLAAGQTQIFQQLQQPVSAEVDPALLAGINAIAQSQANHAALIGQLQSRLEAILTPPPYSLIAAQYTVSQSSNYGTSLIGSYSTLNDGLGNTGVATNAGGNEWIKATFSSAQTIRAVQVGGGNLAGWGGVAPYLNGRVIQYSTDDVNWHSAALISGVEDFLPNQFRLIPLGQAVTARFWRILSNSWLSTTELRFFG